MAQLTERKIIELFKEEWASRVLQLEKSLDKFLKSDVTKKGIISPDTKVKHKASQLLYTIDEVTPTHIVLRTPEGKLFAVDADELAQEYSLD